MVQPDLLVICDQENIKEDDTYMGTPTLVVEILSEKTRSRDLIKKLDLYIQSGVEEYWIVNPFAEEITVYWFKEREIENSTTFKKGERAASFVFPGLGIDVNAGSLVNERTKKGGPAGKLTAFDMARDWRLGAGVFAKVYVGSVG